MSIEGLSQLLQDIESVDAGIESQENTNTMSHPKMLSRSHQATPLKAASRQQPLLVHSSSQQALTPKTDFRLPRSNSCQSAKQSVVKPDLFESEVSNSASKKLPPVQFIDIKHNHPPRFNPKVIL